MCRYNSTVHWLGAIGNKQLEDSFSAARIMSLVTPLLSDLVVVTTHIVSELFLIFIFLGYALLSRIRPRHGLAGDIDVRIQTYIRLKTFVCILVGLLITVIFYILGVELAGVFGLLTFVLNYIPNVGAFVASLLPIPIVILDPHLAPAQKVLAFLIYIIFSVAKYLH